MSENRYQDTTPTNPYHEAPEQPTVTERAGSQRDVAGQRVDGEQQRLDAEPLDAAPGADPVAADADPAVDVDRDKAVTRDVAADPDAPVTERTQGNAAGLVDNAQNDGFTH